MKTRKGGLGKSYSLNKNKIKISVTYLKLNLLKVLANPLTYQPRHLQSHSLKIKDKCTTNQWVNWMKDVTDFEIAWICPWWKLKYATLELYDHCIPIPGLHYSTFISPSHLLTFVISMDVHSSLWLFYPTLKVFPSGRISWIKWRLCGPIDH